MDALPSSSTRRLVYEKHTRRDLIALVSERGEWRRPKFILESNSDLIVEAFV